MRETTKTFLKFLVNLVCLMFRNTSMTIHWPSLNVEAQMKGKVSGLPIDVPRAAAIMLPRTR